MKLPKFFTILFLSLCICLQSCSLIAIGVIEIVNEPFGGNTIDASIQTNRNGKNVDITVIPENEKAITYTLFLCNKEDIIPIAEVKADPLYTIENEEFKMNYLPYAKFTTDQISGTFYIAVEVDNGSCIEDGEPVVYTRTKFTKLFKIR